MKQLQHPSRILCRFLLLPFILSFCLTGLILFDNSIKAQDLGGGSGPLTWGTSGSFAPASLSGNIVGMTVDTQGNINVLSHYLNPSNENDALYLSRRTAAGVWLPTERIDNNGQDIISPKMATDAGGNVHVIWIQDVNPQPGFLQHEVMYNKRTSGAGWGTPELLSTSPSSSEDVQDSLGISLAANSRGDVIVSWVAQIQFTPQNFYNYALVTRFKSVGGEWQPYQLANVAFAKSDNTVAPVIQMDDAGDSYISWTIGVTSSDKGVYFNFRPYEGNWGNASKVTVNSTPVNIYWNNLYITPDGQVFGLFSIGWFVWTTLTTTGEWQVLSNVPTIPNNPYGCDLTGDNLVLNAQRRILMLRTCQSSPHEIFYFYSTNGGVNWSNPAKLTHQTTYDESFIGVDLGDNGYAYALWNEEHNSSGPRKFMSTEPLLATASKQVNSPVAIPGASSRYTVTLQNTLPFALPFTVSDPLPNGTTYIPGSAIITTGSITTASTEVNWTGSIPINGTARLAFSVLVDGSITGTATLLNEATVTLPNYADVILPAYMFVNPDQAFLPLMQKP